MRLGSLFSGIGGLDLAVEWHYGARTVWHSEIDPLASRVLARHWPDAINHGDLTRIDWSSVEPVDIITGGWPCQPFSLAGKRRTEEDARALWPYVAHAVAALRPRLVVLENVDAIRRPDPLGRAELGRATRDLAALGYSVAWRRTLASEAGAPHRRARIFIVATDTDRPRLEGRQAGPRAHELDSGAHGLDLAGRVAPPSWGCPACGGLDADCATCNFDLRVGHGWGELEPAIARWAEVTGWWPPAARDAEHRLTARFAEWMQGYEPGWITDTPGCTRRDAIRAAGNAVCPWQALVALEAIDHAWLEADA